MIWLAAGLCLTTVSWVISWSSIPTLSEHAFFPLWLGYVVAINGLSETLCNDSLVRRMGCSFLWLFAASLPLWWFFESANQIVSNWHYVSARPVTGLEYFVRASIDFSIVVPAVLSTAALIYSILYKRYSWLSDAKFNPPVVASSHLALSALIGGFCLVPLIFAPQETFPLVWIAPILVLEPFVCALQLPSLLRKLVVGDLNALIAVTAGALVCGFFWELWNYYSLPKWIYTIPYVGFWKIFEMPALGYLGYPFFGVIVYLHTVLLFSAIRPSMLMDSMVFARPFTVR